MSDPICPWCNESMSWTGVVLEHEPKWVLLRAEPNVLVNRADCQRCGNPVAQRYSMRIHNGKIEIDEPEYEKIYCIEVADPPGIREAIDKAAEGLARAHREAIDKAAFAGPYTGFNLFTG